MKERYNMENLIQNLYNLDNKIAYSCLKELEVISYTSNEVYKFFETFAGVDGLVQPKRSKLPHITPVAISISGNSV